MKITFKTQEENVKIKDNPLRRAFLTFCLKQSFVRRIYFK